MAEAVAGLLASAFVGIAKDKLGSAIAEQARLLWNFGDDLEDMKNDLEFISAVLEDAEKQSVEKNLVRVWLKQLKDAAIDISDMLEDYQDTCDQANAKMPKVLSCLPVSYNKIAMANRMTSLREKLRKIRNKMDTFNFIKGSITTKEQPYDDVRETTSYSPKEPVIGRDREKKEIIKMLSANTNNDEIVIVPIYGFGGIGKSTLARLVYNDALEFKKYDYKVWVYVSQVYNLRSIGNSIVSKVQRQKDERNRDHGYRDQQNRDLQEIEQSLHELLHEKKVLIVLDDLWEDKNNELEKLKMMLHVKGSNVDVIVTTRKEEIARKVSTGQQHNLQTLEYDKCWEIIKRYSEFELKSNKEKMEQIGVDIAKKCGGVALAARAVGFILRKIDDVSGWAKINSSDILNGSSEDNDVLPSLKLSYERMTPQLRICFSYCAIFPKGHNIIEDDLVQQWIALGFTEQSKAKQYITELLGMSFLHVSKSPSTSHGHLVQYTMHDLVHHLATRTVKDELKVFDVAPRRNTCANKYCRYSVLTKYDQTMKLENMPSKMRALRFSDCGELLDIRAGAFSFAKCLRTLDFSECTGILLPASIGRLKHLRFLNAPRMQNDSLPECITELSKLQYLNINGSSKVTKLPESLVNLQNLLHLDLSECSSMKHLGGVRGLTALQHLDISRSREIDLQDLSGVLANLTNLKYVGLINLIISGPKESASYVPDWIGGMANLEHLDLSWNTGLACLPASIGNLQRLHTLDLTGCWDLKSLPESVLALGLKTLVLSECSIELFDQTSSLVHFSETLPYFRVRADDVKGCSNLHLLEGINVDELRIRLLENVRSLEEANKVKLLEKQNLSELSLHWTVGAVRLLEDKDLLGELVPPRGLKHMCLEGYSSAGFPGWLMGTSRHLANLVSIELGEMPTCSDLPPLGQLAHLEKLFLEKLPGIKRIDREFCGGKGAFRRLSYVRISQMEGLEVWNTTYSVEDGVEFMFPVLDTLKIYICPRLRFKPCPPTFRECHITWSHQVLSLLEEVDQRSRLSSPNRAIKLDIQINDESCQNTRLFHYFPNLRELCIYEGLTESIRHLTSLESLKLSSFFNMVLLPEWLGDLSSLKSLVIQGCQSIESLPSYILHLPKLQTIEIRSNPKLKQWCESEENKAKLAHINVELIGD